MDGQPTDRRRVLWRLLWRCAVVCVVGLGIWAWERPAAAPAGATPLVATATTPLVATATTLLVATATTRWAVHLRQAPRRDAAILTLLPPGTAVRIDAWSTDAARAAWYHGGTPAGAGWVYGDSLTLAAGQATHPAAVRAPFTGTSLWLTYAVLQDTPVGTIVRTAQAAGVRALYVEVASSGPGFYGGPGLGTLLPLAHRAGLRVLVWVYPYLRDLADDLALTLAAVRYTAPSGDRPDGLLADVEENMDEGAVRAYGQIPRAALGPNAPLAIATFPPQVPKGQTYPFATAALSWTVIVPMDYWHLQDRAYSAAEVATFVTQSVQEIRARTSPAQAVAVLGQWFAPAAFSPAPSAAELRAAARAAGAAGAIGLGFYDWGHATAADLRVLAALPSAVAYPSGRALPPVQVAVPWLNLRAARSLAAPTVATLAAGTPLAVRAYRLPWVAVVAPTGQSGYVYGGDVQPVSAAPSSPAPRSSALALVVRVPLAHLRAGPSLQSVILTTLGQGTRLRVQRVQGAWAQVVAPGGLWGWIWRALTQSGG